MYLSNALHSPQGGRCCVVLCVMYLYNVQSANGKVSRQFELSALCVNNNDDSLS